MFTVPMNFSMHQQMRLSKNMAFSFIHGNSLINTCFATFLIGYMLLMLLLFTYLLSRSRALLTVVLCPIIHQTYRQFALSVLLWRLTKFIFSYIFSDIQAIRPECLTDLVQVGLFYKQRCHCFIHFLTIFLQKL